MIDLRLHAPTLLGTLAMLLAAVLALGLVPRWQAEQARADQVVQQRARQAVPAAPATVPTAADQRLVPALPPADAAPQRLAALVGLAQQHGLTLDSVRQSAPLRLGSGAAALPAERVPLRLTGSGPYSAWRRFVAEALQHDDALLLDQLRLSRSGPGAATLAADLQWLLLQRLGSAAPPSTPTATSVSTSVSASTATPAPGAARAATTTTAAMAAGAP